MWGLIRVDHFYLRRSRAGHRMHRVVVVVVLLLEIKFDKMALQQFRLRWMPTSKKKKKKVEIFGAWRPSLAHPQNDYYRLAAGL